VIAVRQPDAKKIAVPRPQGAMSRAVLGDLPAAGRIAHRSHQEHFPTPSWRCPGGALEKPEGAGDAACPNNPDRNPFPFATAEGGSLRLTWVAHESSHLESRFRLSLPAMAFSSTSRASARLRWVYFPRCSSSPEFLATKRQPVSFTGFGNYHGSGTRRLRPQRDGSGVQPRLHRSPRWAVLWHVLSNVRKGGAPRFHDHPVGRPAVVSGLIWKWMSARLRGGQGPL